MKSAIRAVLAVALLGALPVIATAKNASEVLDEARADMQREVEAQARYEMNRRGYGGTLYGRPGQSNSSALREQAIRAAIGSIFGTCKKSGGSIDFNMDVSDILANNVIEIPEIKPPTGGGLLNNLGGLLPTPSAISGDKVKIGNSWMPTKDYEAARAESERALRELAKNQAIAAVAPTSAKQAVTPTAQAKPSASGAQQQRPQAAKPAVSQIWAPKK